MQQNGWDFLRTIQRCCCWCWCILVIIIVLYPVLCPPGSSNEEEKKKKKEEKEMKDENARMCICSLINYKNDIDFSSHFFSSFFSLSVSLSLAFLSSLCSTRMLFVKSFSFSLSFTFRFFHLLLLLFLLLFLPFDWNVIDKNTQTSVLDLLIWPVPFFLFRLSRSNYCFSVIKRRFFFYRYSLIDRRKRKIYKVFLVKNRKCSSIIVLLFWREMIKKTRCFFLTMPCEALPLIIKATFFFFLWKNKFALSYKSSISVYQCVFCVSLLERSIKTVCLCRTANRQWWEEKK